MEKYLNQIICGDSLEVLRGIPSESVDCLITSPPYWNLRDYNIEGQLGLEPTFHEYISKLCDMFDEVKRVLKSKGTCFVNLGDPYSGNKNGKTDNKVSEYLKKTSSGIRKKATIQEKCLCQIPSRFAIEMCERDWILRNTIIWHKKNAMPSSVLDRLTNKYEQVFFFTKSSRYFFDINSIRVPFETDEKRPNGLERNREHDYNSKFNTLQAEKIGSPRARISKKFNTTAGTKTREQEEQANRFGIRRNPETVYDRNPKGKNPGDVWTLVSEPYPDAHFAMFPQKLIEPMILAGCPVGGVVLDCFMGAGTTAVVAKKLGRNYIGIELNPEYIKIAEQRIAATTPPLW